VAAVLGRPLEQPAVHVHVHTERGWQANDTAALRQVAPGAFVHIDSSPSATIEAMVRMASSDILVVGPSVGWFHTWPWRPPTMAAMTAVPQHPAAPLGSSEGGQLPCVRLHAPRTHASAAETAGQSHVAGAAQSSPRAKQASR